MLCENVGFGVVGHVGLELVILDGAADGAERADSKLDGGIPGLHRNRADPHAGFDQGSIDGLGAQQRIVLDKLKDDI